MIERTAQIIITFNKNVFNSKDKHLKLIHHIEMVIMRARKCYYILKELRKIFDENDLFCISSTNNIVYF